MSFRPSNGRRCGGGGILAVALAVAVASWAADGSVSPNRAIEISDPRGNTLITNLNQLSTETTVEPDLEVDFLTPSVLTQPRGSLSGAWRLPPPPGGTVFSSKRARDLRDQRKNWAFGSPDDVIRDKALREVLNLPDYSSDGDETRSSSTVGRYYERMVRGQAGQGNPMSNNDWFGLRRTSEERNRPAQIDDGISLLSGLYQSDRSLKSLLNPDLSARSSSAGGGSDGLLEAFGLSSDRGGRDLDFESLRAREAHETQLKRFQDLLNKSYEADPLVPARSGSAANPWLGSSPAASPGLDLRSPFATMSGAAVHSAPLPPIAPAPPLSSSLSPTPYIPQPPQVNSMLMRRPEVTAPRRAF
jgi:hypothetical protein